MIQISNCPNTGLVRKLDYQFFWLKLTRRIIVQCMITHFKRDEDLYQDYLVALSAHTANPTGTTMPVENYDTKIDNLAIRTFTKELTASDTLVNPTNGAILTQEQISDYNNAASAYEQYPAQYALYQSNLTNYNNYLSDLAIYQSAYTAYTIAYSAWTANPTGSTMPIAPIAPIQVQEPIEPVQPPAPGPAPIQEYDYYANVLGVTPIILPNLIESIIAIRDLEGKFNI
jgi:hypothetical protein